MKQGWEVKPLEELYDITSSKRVLKKDWEPKGVPFYRTREIKKLALNGFVENDLFISEEKFREYKSKFGVPCAGDLMVTAIGTLGLCYLVKPKDRFYFKDASVLWFKQKSGVLPEFIEYAFQTDDVLEQVHGGEGATVGTFTITRAKNTTIPLPPLEEQKRIVAVLDEAFEGLARARAHAEANLQNARELFESYLTDVFSVPAPDWVSATLGSLCKKITVGHVGPMAERYTENGIPFLRSQNVRPFRIDLTDVKFIDTVFMAELKKSELRPGDVAIVRTGYPGTCAVIPDEIKLANCADLVIARTGPSLNPHFLAMLLNSSFGKSHVAAVSVGAAQKHFNVGSARVAAFAIPPLNSQAELVEMADEIRRLSDEVAELILLKMNDLDQLKQSLLQKAFAGELT